ncbi:tRNA lysidine(34) synthetase TilS [Dehalococcoides mccartyi]|uniref:tRNA lysidine(34) synthetase TilS n=1 Tax=Dehalococcoides mccartyi TaxID=61435 RepID=UPI0006BD90A0|nr:tRNA lysidine(34) synthetase TilS [Dehalococcoides mccartyi]BAS32295.1 tRNA(Ile)-lysidine synthetase [Dehalococcoides mccartyi IBARAKI]
MDNTEILTERVSKYIKKQGLVSAGDEILLAVSGGPDSVCMLYIMHKLSREMGFSLRLAHLNHGLRAEESDRDAAYVIELASALGLPLCQQKVSVKAYQAEHHLSLEEAAREMRYAFLCRTAAEFGSAAVAVGHTLDDNIETVMLHLVRGSGTRGLQGLRPVLNRTIAGAGCLRVIRPLLCLGRAETQVYCREAGLLPRQDITNLSTEPLRNRIRLEVLPLLKTINPAFEETILRTAFIAGEEMALLDEVTSQMKAELVIRQDDVLMIEKIEMQRLHPALKRNLLRQMMEELLGGLKDIEARHIENIVQTMDKPAGRRIDLPYKLVFQVDYEHYLLGWGIDELCPYPPCQGEYRLGVGTGTFLDGWVVKTEILPSPIGLDLSESSLVAYLDMDKAGTDLIVRTRAEGDQFQPLGMEDAKSLKEFMIDNKIPRNWRARVPLLISGKEILWLVGYRIGESAKVDENTRRVLRVEFRLLG